MHKCTKFFKGDSALSRARKMVFADTLMASISSQYILDNFSIYIRNCCKNAF